MGLRQQAYWLRQADAVNRRMMMSLAHAVSIGMAGSEDKQKAIDELELVETKEQSKAKQSKGVWDMLKFMGGGKSSGI